MKKIFLFYLTLIFCLLATQNTYAQDVYRVKNQILNVRSNPSSSSRKLGQLKAGDKIEVLSINNGWAQFVYKSQKAFVSASYIELIDDNKNKPAEQTSQQDANDSDYSEIDYSTVSTSEESQEAIIANTGVNDYVNVPKLFYTLKYDNLNIEKTEGSINGLSFGVLINPLDFHKDKKSSFAMQAGLFADYYWASKTVNGYNTSMHYFGLSAMFHPLGWSYSNGKGKGIAIHGGFDITWRIAGKGSTKYEGKELFSGNLFSKDDMGEGKYKHFGTGLSIAVDVVLAKFYSTIGYKFIGPIMNDTETYGFYLAAGYSF